MFLGIEIGGTKLQLGLGRGDGAIAAVERTHVEPGAGAAGIRHEIVRLVPALLAHAGLRRQDIRGVGIGFGGPVRPESGTVVKSHQIAGWDEFPLAEWCRSELGWPTVVHNDADTAGLAEACFGAGRGFSPVFYITIGSGIGGGLIIDGRIYRGSGAGAAEVGHVQLPPPGTLLSAEIPTSDTSLPRPTVESICSGWAIAQRMQRTIAAALREHPDEREHAVWAAARPDAEQILSMVGGKLEQVTAEVTGEAARSGNCLARKNLAISFRVLGWAIAQVIALLCPRRIVIGGGVSLMGEDLLFRPLREEVSRQVFRPFADCYEIVPAALGESVVVHGALQLAKQAMASE